MRGDSKCQECPTLYIKPLTEPNCPNGRCATLCVVTRTYLVLPSISFQDTFLDRGYILLCTRDQGCSRDAEGIVSITDHARVGLRWARRGRSSDAEREPCEVRRAQERKRVPRLSRHGRRCAARANDRDAGVGVVADAARPQSVLP